MSHRSVIVLLAAVTSCDLTPPPEPVSHPVTGISPGTPARTIPEQVAAQHAPTPEPPPQTRLPRDVTVHPQHPDPTSPDPQHGHFTMLQATPGIPPSPTIPVSIETSMGTFTCQLFASRAPDTVANFIGLARGLRDFWDPVVGQWVHRPFYDGSVFHRVIPGFMIQGGDQLRSGFGGTGYEFHDENTSPHDAAGLLCMANHGPNTNSGQFFITEGPKPHLDGSYSIFGRCEPADLVGRIARVPRDTHDVPMDPVTIQHVRFSH